MSVRSLILATNQEKEVLVIAQTKFTTSDKNHVGDDYFLNSGDKIRYFLEDEAVNENGQLTRDKTKAVNKIGHGAPLCGTIFLTRLKCYSTTRTRSDLSGGDSRE